MSELDGKTIAVTGAASGLGRAVAEAAARAGAHVVLADLDEGGMADALEAIGRFAPAGVGVRAIRTDVRVADECDRLVELAVSAFGALDGIACAAGYNRKSETLKMPLGEWNDVLATNLTGCYLSARAAAAAMLRDGRTGAIVTFSSRIGAAGTVGSPHYAAAKGGILALTKSLALEWAAQGVRVNAIAPGLVATPNASSMVSPEEMAAVARATPLGRLGTPEEIADVVCFLLSDASRFMTGQTVHVNGGRLMP